MAFTLGLSSVAVTDKPKRSCLSGSYGGSQKLAGHWRRSSLDVSVSVLTVHTDAPSVKITPVQSPLLMPSANSPKNTSLGSGGPSNSAAATSNGRTKLAVHSIDPQQLWESARTLHNKFNGIWQSLLNRVHSYAPHYAALMLQTQLAGRGTAVQAGQAGLASVSASGVLIMDHPTGDLGSLLPPSALNLPNVRIGGKSSPNHSQAQSRAGSKPNSPRHSLEQKAAHDPAQSAAPAATPLHRFLTEAVESEVSYASMLADLCDLAYDVKTLSSEALQNKHMLMLIATSMGSQCASVASVAHAHAYAGESIVLPDVSAEEAKAMHMHVDTAAQQVSP